MADLVEKITRLIGDHYDGYADPVDTPNNWARAEPAARAAINVVLEAAAQVADDKADGCRDLDTAIAFEALGVAIRALKESENNG